MPYNSSIRNQSKIYTEFVSLTCTCIWSNEFTHRRLKSQSDINDTHVACLNPFGSTLKRSNVILGWYQTVTLNTTSNVLSTWCDAILHSITHCPRTRNVDMQLGQEENRTVVSLSLKCEWSYVTLYDVARKLEIHYFLNLLRLTVFHHQ